MDVAVAFGNVTRELRVKAGLTQEQLGFEADLSRTFVSILEPRQQQPALTTIFKLATSLGTTPSQIIAFVEKMTKLQ